MGEQLDVQGSGRQADWMMVWSIGLKEVFLINSLSCRRGSCILARAFLNDSGSISDWLGDLLLTIIPNNILAYWTTPEAKFSCANYRQLLSYHAAAAS